MPKLIHQGAEAKIFKKGSTVIKERFEKGYRIAQIDSKLRGFRTRRESKVLQKLQSIKFPSPKLISNDEKQSITMEYLHGILLKDILEKKDCGVLGKEIGEKIAILHDNHIIHGDLTTSNMILRERKIHFIDFGLSFFSHKIEDMAVDLHALRQALESKHHLIFKECFGSILEGYKKSVNASTVIKRLEQVEKRGRYKHK